MRLRFLTFGAKKMRLKISIKRKVSIGHTNDCLEDKKGKLINNNYDICENIFI